jgi:hypothetical protein
MGLGIDIAKIRAVLLPSGWMDIKPGSFEIGAYEFLDENSVVVAGPPGGAGSSGFRFRDANGNSVCGPVASIMALRTLTSTA